MKLTASVGSLPKVAFGVLFLLIPPPLEAQTEVFLLTPHLHYTYSYFSYYGSYSLLDGSVTSIDSGLVEYVVLDSSIVNDTTVVWDVKQIVSALHKWRGLGQDSVWHVDSSSVLQVTEHTNGLHALVSAGVVWKFPLVHAWWEQSNQPVCRYSASDIVREVVDSIYSQGIVRDTVWFSHTSGFSRRTRISFYHPGNTTFRDSLSVQLVSSPVPATEVLPQSPALFVLQQNYPNPFNPTTTIRYQLPISDFVRLTVCDVLGREISVLVNGRQVAGVHEVDFDGRAFSSGVYFYRLELPSGSLTRKMTVVR